MEATELIRVILCLYKSDTKIIKKHVLKMPITIIGQVPESDKEALSPEQDDERTLSRRERKKFKRDSKILFYANIIAGVVHLISFLIALTLSIIFRDRIYRGTITRTFTEDVPTLRTLGTYTLSWTILPFPIKTSLSHLITASPFLFGHYANIVLAGGKSKEAGWNWIRWTEYAITASYMTWTVAQLAGITDLSTLFLLVLLNAIMQLGGGLGHELINRGWRIDGEENVQWWSFLLGFLPFAGIWGVILAAFIIQALSNSPPAFVWVIVIAMFFFFLSFVVPILLHYSRWQPFIKVGNLEYEIMFIVLSLVSKVAFDWTLVLGSIFI